MMRGWDSSVVVGTEHYTYVNDQDYREMLELVINSDGTVTVIAENIKLDAKGVENLRKKLQQAERYINKEGETP